MFNEYNDIVGIDEMCEMLGIGKNNAYDLLKENHIKAYRNGKTWRIPKLAVIEYVIKESGIK